MMKISPIIVPTSPPMYDKYLSTFSKLRLYVVDSADFLRTREIRASPETGTKGSVRNLSGILTIDSS